MSNITAVTPFRLTAAGHALQLKVQAGVCKLELAGVKIGDGYITDETVVEDITAIINEIPTADGSAETSLPIATLAEVYVGKGGHNNDMCMIHTIIKNGNNADTRIRECAILAKETDGSIILYGYINLGDSAMPFPPYDGTTPIVYNWKFPLYISNEANINMDFGFIAGVSREDFNAHAGDTGNPHKVTFGQLGATASDIIAALEYAPANIKHVHNVNDITSYFTLSGSLAVVSAYGYTKLYHYAFTGWIDGESRLISEVQTTFGAATFGKSVGEPNGGFGSSTRVYVRLYVKDGEVFWDEYYDSIPSDVSADEVTDIGSFTVTNTPYADGCITVGYSGNPQYDEDLTLAGAIIKLAYEIHKLNARRTS